MMGCSGLLILGLVLSVAHSLETPDAGGDSFIEIAHNVTAVLGEAVYLRCRYAGEGKIQSAMWKRQINSRVKSKGLVGFADGKPIKRSPQFSEPDSISNLTVRMNVTSVNLEGKYICEFELEEEDNDDHVFLTVQARPEVQVQVNAETINGTHFQSVSCSAVGARPPAQISWLVDGLPPSGFPFTVDVIETAHSEGTSTQSSTLRFPTRLQDEESVTCVVQHPTLPTPTLTTVGVETYTRPNISIKAEMVQQGGSEFWVVSCVSSGGRPDTDVSLALNGGGGGEELEREGKADSDTQTTSVRLPAIQHQGSNVTCVFNHPKFTHTESRALTLPTFYLSGVQLLHSEPGMESDDVEALELQEGHRDTVIPLKITGNVPRYNITCKKDNESLPEGVEVDGSGVTVQGPMEPQHAGLYECIFSYHHLQATLTLNVTVKPEVLQPVPPTLRVDLRTKDGRRVIECFAADAVPVANMSWLLPEGVSGVSWFNFTSHNGSHSVRGVLLLPACSPWELTAECVINHPAFEQPQNRSITLPICAPPNITVTSFKEWRDGVEHTKVECSVKSVAPAANVTWRVGNGDISPVSETEVGPDGLVSARSSVHFLSSLYSGQTLTCTVEHPSLEAPEEREIRILVHKAPLLSVSVGRQRASPLWLAECDCRGEGVGNNLSWVLPGNTKGQTLLSTEKTGHVLKTSLTYQFPLALHEGQDLTCVYHSDHGAMEKTIHIPRYYISSVKVLNHTTPLEDLHGHTSTIHRLALQENHHNQRILLRVEGNMPDYDLDCQRSDGLFVHMEGTAIVFQSELTERDGGLYICWASFYHHTASVRIQVEVMSEDKLLALIAMICISSASAIVLVAVVTLWVCCKRKNRPQYKKKESLSALTSLMQEPEFPEVKKPPASDSSKEYAQLISYSIVIDVKSKV